MALGRAHWVLGQVTGGEPAGAALTLNDVANNATAPPIGSIEETFVKIDFIKLHLKGESHYVVAEILRKFSMQPIFFLLDINQG